MLDLFGRKQGDLSQLEPPWKTAGPSIFDRLSAPDFAGSEMVLQAEDAAEGEITFAPGLFDAMFGGRSEEGPDAAELANLVRACLASPTPRSVKALYQGFAGASAMQVADALIDELLNGTAFDLDRCAQLFEWFAKGAPDLDAAKLSIAMLGMVPNPRHRDLFVTFGKHEEFASFAAVALGNCSPDPEEDLFQLARGLNGWGRITLVERLAETERADIKDWVLREGFRNSIMNEYLACLAAQMGDLAGQLRGPADAQLLDAAAEIFIALCNAGPAEDMRDYADAEDAVRLFVTHMEAPNLVQCRALAALGSYAKGSDGWPHLAQRLDAVLASAPLRDTVDAGLGQDDAQTFWLAKATAQELGWDIWEVIWSRHVNGPDLWWFDLLRTDDPDRALRVVANLCGMFDLEEVTGAPEAGFAGFGYASAVDEAMDAVTQELRNFSGVGGDVVLTALRGRAVRLRYLACAALEQWARGDWPEGAVAALQAASKAEPDQELREEMSGLARK